MDEVVRKLAGVGLPAVVLLITMATTGLTGAAAITAALAMLGPGGMIGGIVFLGIIGLASDALAKYGLESMLVEIYKTRRQNGVSRSNLRKEIAWLPISDELKLVLKNKIARTSRWYEIELNDGLGLRSPSGNCRIEAQCLSSP